MNKIFSVSLLLGAALTLTSCAGEEANIFDQSAAERLNAASELYSSRLMAQPNGWAMQLYPTTQDKAPYGSGYLVLMDFNSDHSVNVSMNNELSSNKYVTDKSNWDVNTDDGPVLSFDTHNSVMHVFSDPDDVPSTGTSDDPNDETGTGIGGDYEFIIVDAPEDASYMMLKGKKNGTYNLLTPVEEGVDYETYLSDVNAFQNKIFPATAPSGDFMQLGDSLYHFDGASDRLPSIYLDGKDATLFETFNPFLVTKRGEDYYLRFRDALELADGTTEQEFRYNVEKDIFEGSNNAANIIRGYDKYRFLSEALADGHKFQLTARSEMSDKMKDLYNKVVADFKARKYTFNNLQLQSNSDGSPVWRISFKSSGTSTRNYSVTVSGEGENAVIQYAGPADSASETVINAIPSLKDLLNALSGNLKLSAAETGFDLSNLKFISASDSDLWYILKYNN